MLTLVAHLDPVPIVALNPVEQECGILRKPGFVAAVQLLGHITCLLYAVQASNRQQL